MAREPCQLARWFRLIVVARKEVATFPHDLKRSREVFLQDLHTSAAYIHVTGHDLAAQLIAQVAVDPFRPEQREERLRLGGLGEPGYFHHLVHCSTCFIAKKLFSGDLSNLPMP